ncbi:DUF262 domain-containing protein [Treponema sp.]|uniref:DUF262 domain-containing protein n=1 Tax=Treponema sp. TaxID=166 RepID=UPI0025D4D1CB|nr:DUF262 domain-containing HNH endonuclease family protein [Treponema sp.]MBR4320956.1 DUF262 domain-containing protein [Treponema sp.]
MELKSLSDIFQKKLFRISDYQRGYAWQSKQLTDFWEDLLNLQTNRYHYTGLLSLNEVKRSSSHKDLWLLDAGYKIFHIVDGQQRLTTFIILLNEIIDLVRNQKENLGKSNTEIVIGVEKISSICEQYLFKEKPGEIIKTYIFDYDKSKNNTSASDYLKNKILSENTPVALDETYYTKHLKIAKDFFKRQLENLNKQEGLSVITDLYKKLTQNLKFNVNEIKDNYDVFVAFETMNNRGRALTNLEILKNRLIYLTTLYPSEKLPDDERDELRSEINQAWSEVYKQIGRNPGSLLFDDEYLRAHWICYFTYTRNSSEEYKRFLLSKFSVKNILEEKTVLDLNATEEEAISSDSEDIEDENTGTETSEKTIDTEYLEPKEIKNYVNSLSTLSRFWYESFFPNDYNSLNPEEKLWLGRLNRIGINYFRPLVMVALSKRKIQTTEKIKLFSAIERFIFIVFRLGSTNSSYCSSEFYHFAKKLNYDEVNISEITERLNSLTESNIDFAISSFIKKTKKNFEEKDGYYSWRYLKYFLYEYEYSLSSVNKIEKISWEQFSKFEKNKTSIEHILPQTHDCEYWKNTFSNYSEKEVKDFSNALGNLLALDENINSSLQNYSFPEKKGEKVKNGHSIRRGYKHGSHSEIEVSKNKDWTAVEIYERSKMLIKFMKERWNLPFIETQIEQLIYVKLKK